jgi:GntR family transcriptional regulator/MocR family aminotransferase
MNKEQPLYQALYQDIKDKILQNEYQEGTKLESVRSLSKKLGLSTTTIERAYSQLSIEGYIKSIPRSGYIVLNIHKTIQSEPIHTVRPIQYTNTYNNQLTTDLFDIKSYKSIVNKVINYDSDKLYQECDPRGEFELREEIRKYVLSERNVTCDVNQIIIGPGIQSLLHIILSLNKMSTVSYLNPEFPKAMNIFRDYNYSLLPKDTIDEITASKSDYLYISPSNIYPTGDILKVQDRNKLINWATKHNSYIIEDDYNFFIRYNSFTIPSIHSYNSNQVIYMGSFSKTIIPSIRISFMILPPKLYNLYYIKYNNYAQGVSKLDQLSLALFMKEGLFKRHTKKLYNLYKEKNDLVLKAIDDLHINHLIQIASTDSNLHLVINFLETHSYQIFKSNADKLNLKYEPIKDKTMLILPYSGIENKDIQSTITQLFKHI